MLLKMSQSSSTSFHMIFTGRVQGVGFRYTARRLAVALGLRGWVRNLPDGHSVELWAQGPAARVDELVGELQRQFTVDDVHRTPGELPEGLGSFEIYS